MLFDKQKVIDAVKSALTPSERARSSDIEIALLVCLDEIASSLIAKGQLQSYEVTLATSTREVTLNGEADDLRTIYAIKYTRGDSEYVLSPLDLDIFLREKNSSTAESGDPVYYTVISGDDGFPTVKFDVPVISTATIEVFYLPDIAPENIQKIRSAPAAISGTLAYFYGIESDVGGRYYARFKDQIRMIRAADSFMARPDSRFKQDEFMDDLATVRQQFNSGRAR